MHQTSRQNIDITYDAKSGRFIIVSPPWAIDHIRAIPNRRWDAKRRVWTAPALRANAAYMLDRFPSQYWSPDAVGVARGVVKVKSLAPIADFPSSYTFRTQPRSYQEKALKFSWKKESFAYYMDMGTGKTKTSIDLFSAYFLEGDVDRLLVVTKFSTRMNWEREFAIHCPVPYEVMVLDTSKPKVFDAFNTSVTDGLKILIVGTESLAAGSATTYADRFVNTSTRVGMIVDEAHMIKTHNAVRSKNAVKIGKGAKYKLVMTGTPIANAPLDLYMQFEFLDENIIGTGDFYSFRNRYAVMGGFEGKQIIGYQNMEELIELVSPYVYQVRKSEVLTELPPKVYEIREVQFNEEQRNLYTSLAKKNRAVMGDRGLTVNTVLERMLRLQEICGGIVTFERNPDLWNSAKYEHSRIPGNNPKVEELLSIAEEYQVSTIVWCRFIEEIHMVSEALRAKYGADQVVEIYGQVSEKDRDHNVQELFQKKKARFLVGNAATGGTGLNMTAAELVVYFSNSFNYVERDQSEDRAHRIGQTKSVLYIDLVMEKSVDGAILDALQNKKNVSEFVRESINSKNVEQLIAAA
jgi:SNF2 family DNA or RNA helicase